MNHKSRFTIHSLIYTISLCLSSAYLTIVGSARTEEPKSKAFFLLNINPLVSTVNINLEALQKFTKLSVSTYVNLTSTTLYTPANNFHFQAKILQLVLSPLVIFFQWQSKITILPIFLPCFKH